MKGLGWCPGLACVWATNLRQLLLHQMRACCVTSPPADFGEEPSISDHGQPSNKGLDRETRSLYCYTISYPNLLFLGTYIPRSQQTVDTVSSDGGFGRIVLSPGSSQPRALVFAWSLLGCIIIVVIYHPHGTRPAGKSRHVVDPRSRLRLRACKAYKGVSCVERISVLAVQM